MPIAATNYDIATVALVKFQPGFGEEEKKKGSQPFYYWPLLYFTRRAAASGDIGKDVFAHRSLFREIPSVQASVNPSRIYLLSTINSRIAKY